MRARETKDAGANSLSRAAGVCAAAVTASSALGANLAENRRRARAIGIYMYIAGWRPLRAARASQPASGGLYSRRRSFRR